MRISDWSSDVCSSDLFDDPVINQAIVRNWGIRRRVNLYPVYPEGKSKDELETEDDKQAYMKALDSLVAQETLMESAGEDKAYFALMRIARRWNDPAILADVVAAKRSEEHTSELQSLMRISYAVFCLKKQTPKTTSA